MNTYYIVEQTLKQLKEDYLLKITFDKTFEKFDKTKFCDIDDYMYLIETFNSKTLPKKEYNTLTRAEFNRLEHNEKFYKILFFDKNDIFHVKMLYKILERLNIIKKSEELYEYDGIFSGKLILTAEEKEEFDKIKKEVILKWEQQDKIKKFKFLFDMVVESNDNSKIKNELIEKINKFIKVYDLNLDLWEHYKERYMI